MTVFPQLKNPPIVEAVVDFRVRPAPGSSLENLDRLRSVVEHDYPEIRKTWLFEGQFSFSAAEASTDMATRRKGNGFVAQSSDGKNIVQLRLDGFSYSRLPPYTSWEQIRPEAFAVWKSYCRALPAESLYRIALRYINRIELPSRSVALEGILRDLPASPVDGRTGVSSFLTRIVVPMDDGRVQACIVRAYNTPPAASDDSVLIDIDVYSEGDYPLGEGELAPYFDTLRNCKNAAFFGILTESFVESLR